MAKSLSEDLRSRLIAAVNAGMSRRGGSGRAVRGGGRDFYPVGERVAP